MRRFNIVMLLDAAGEHVLMCRRQKPPYQGLLNLVGGKLEVGEEPLHAAYRELREETGATIADVQLHHLVTFVYPGGCAGFDASELQAYVGRLRREMEVVEEANPLCWVSLDANFFDMDRFSGEGNIGHILETARRYSAAWLQPSKMEISLVPAKGEDHERIAHAWQCQNGEPVTLHLDEYGNNYLLMVNECMAGYAVLKEETTENGLQLQAEFGILKPFRRCGVGGRVLAMLERIAVREECSLRLRFAVDDAAAYAFCCKYGYMDLVQEGGWMVYVRGGKAGGAHEA